MAREAARSVLPNATEVKIVVSGNARAWRTMLELRTSEGAELEIRGMAIACLRVLQREAPALFCDFEVYVADDRHDAARVAYHKVPPLMSGGRRQKTTPVSRLRIPPPFR